MPHYHRSETKSGRAAEGCACRHAVQGELGQAYNEEAFLFFLAIERNRSERSGRPFLLLLVDVAEPSGGAESVNPTVARELFFGLGLCVRETDFIGWYREGRVAGALLAEFRDGPRREASHKMLQKVKAELGRRLSSDVARRLQVRIHQPSTLDRSDSGRPPRAGAELISGEL